MQVQAKNINKKLIRVQFKNSFLYNNKFVLFIVSTYKNNLFYENVVQKIVRIAKNRHYIDFFK